MKISKIVTPFVTLSLCVLLLLPMAAASASPKETAAVRTITTQGSGLLEAVPNQAKITIGVTSKETSMEQARAANAATATAIQHSLLALGIAADNIRTANYLVSPVYSKPESTKLPEIIGYQISNSVTVTLDNIDLTGQVIDAALQNGANQIQSIQFTIKNDADLTQQVLALAVKDAQNKARAIAQALDKKITGIVSANEGHVSISSVRPQMLSKAMDANPATPIAPGMQQITASVVVVFELN